MGKLLQVLARRFMNLSLRGDRLILTYCVAPRVIGAHGG